MINTFASSSRTQLSTHFNVKEFKCKCGKSHEIKIDSELIVKLEKLYSVLNCSKIIVNSGHRCTLHDKNVGGNGCGQHTKGTAADIVCYDESGKKISSKIVCCAAQDIGFSGIANIDTTYTATHVDVRTGVKWYGDETVTTAYSVTDDFYKHYALSKEDVYAVKKRTADVSIVIDGVKYSGVLSEG